MKKDMLHYSSPAHGDWGVVRMGMLVPESVQLFVCPFACGRHGAIGAMNHGLKDRLSYLYVDQEDIINGYDELIPPGVEELLANLPQRPRVIFIFVSCLDDLLGTDHDSILEILRETHPDIIFHFGHMNPISLDKAVPPPVSVQNNIYSTLLSTSEVRLPHINTIGNLETLQSGGILDQMVEQKGGKVLHISLFDHFDCFQVMAQSSLNLVLRPIGLPAAKDMAVRLGIPYLYHPTTYRPSEIEACFQELLGALEMDPLSMQEGLEKERDQALARVAEAKALLGDTPIIIDHTAVLRPYSLARTLLEFGFQVSRIEADKCLPVDREDAAWLEEHYPDIQRFAPIEHTSLLFDRPLEDSLAIGIQGGYFSGSRYIVNQFWDAGCYGYQGLSLLMERMMEAKSNPMDIQQIIDAYGLVV